MEPNHFVDSGCAAHDSCKGKDDASIVAKDGMRWCVCRRTMSEYVPCDENANLK